MASAAKIGLSYVLGRCVPSVKHNAAKIRITQLQLDERLNSVSLPNVIRPKFSIWLRLKTINSSFEDKFNQKIFLSLSAVLRGARPRICLRSREKCENW